MFPAGGREGAEGLSAALRSEGKASSEIEQEHRIREETQVGSLRPAVILASCSWLSPPVPSGRTSGDQNLSPSAQPVTAV